MPLCVLISAVEDILVFSAHDAESTTGLLDMMT
jgi:hypothetical protein